ncbi:vesicular glutamate transporter 3-like isoform X2 [Haliotis asinina]|uniref:vesicular glutamate transporter 3-like isoform X2 n=1 Tax=Haliotis asinina TaxID=109174 RepID=UPI00353246C5
MNVTRGNEIHEEEIRKPNIPVWSTKRYQLAFLYSLGFAVQGLVMYNLSISIVCMVDLQYIYGNAEINGTNVSTEINRSVNLPQECGGDHNTTTLRECGQKGEFKWSKQVQGLLLGAMFWGYTIGQLFAGWMSQRFGARMVIGLGVGTSAVLTLLSPVAARINPYLLLTTRLLFGVSLAVIYPSMATFWSKWAPPNEYSSIFSVCLSGSTVGNAIVYPIGGLLCGDDVSLGWPFIFYTTGGIAALWTLLWILLARNQPSQVPSISAEEKAYIEASLRHRVQMSRVRPVPWKSMFTSRPVYALMADNFLTNYGIYMLLTQIPTYFNDVHRLNFSSNGAYSMMPVVCMGIATFVCGFLADLLISRKLCSVGVTRKIIITLGTLFPGICMVILAQAEQGQHLFAVSMLCFAVGFVGFGMCGFSTNYVDIAGQFAGILSGIGNAIGSLPGVLAPYVVSVLTPNSKTTPSTVSYST